MELVSVYNERYRGDYMETHSASDRRKVTDFLSAVPATHVRRVLDYGCGQGAWTPLLGRFFPQAKITGTDIAEEGLRKAAALMPQAHFVLLPALEQEPDSSFDVIFSYHVLEHVADAGTVMACLARLLRPGGRLIIILPCANSFSLEECIVRLRQHGREHSITGELRFFYEEPVHLRRLTTAEMITLTKPHALLCEKRRYANQGCGAVQWITASGPAFIRSLCGGNGRTAGATMLLRGLAALLTPLARLAVRHHHAAARAESLPSWRNTLLDGMALITTLIIDGLAQAEWKLLRRWPNGSEQFLIFRKT